MPAGRLGHVGAVRGRRHGHRPRRVRRAAIGFNLLLGIPLLSAALLDRRHDDDHPRARAARLPPAGSGHHRRSWASSRSRTSSKPSSTARLARDRPVRRPSGARGRRRGAARRRHPRGDGHAPRRLPAFGADAAPRDHRHGRAGAPAVQVRGLRRRDRDDARRPRERGDARDGRRDVLGARADEDRHDRGGHRTFAPLWDTPSSFVFAISLLASGLSSSAVGTMAGQIIMQGFIRRQISIWLRRLVTMIPAIVVIAIGLDPTRTLVISQVHPELRPAVRARAAGAVHPAPAADGRRSRTARSTTVVAWVVVGMIVALNLYLIYTTVTGG